MRVIVIDDPTTGERDALDKGLREHAAHLSVPVDREPLAVLLRADEGDVLAGVIGHWYEAHGACIVHDVWVAEELRGHGLGRMLMDRLEEELKERDCHLIHFDLMDFQARDFFERLGYEIIGSVTYPKSGRSRLFLGKSLRG